MIIYQSCQVLSTIFSIVYHRCINGFYTKIFSVYFFDQIFNNWGDCTDIFLNYTIGNSWPINIFQQAIIDLR